MSDIGGPDISEVSVVPALFSERADLKKDVVGSNPLVEMAGYKDPMQFDPEDRGTGPCRLMTEDIVPDLSKNPNWKKLNPGQQNMILALTRTLLEGPSTTDTSKGATIGAVFSTRGSALLRRFMEGMQDT